MFIFQNEAAPRASRGLGKIQPRLLILTYAWGGLQETDINVQLYTESLRETGSTADVVILTHDPLVNSTATWLLQQHKFKVEMVPDVVVQTSTVSGDPVLFRFVAWNYYLKRHRSNYTHVMTTDMDVFFQADPLHCLPQIQALQVFEENPAINIAKCPIHKSWIQGCPKVQNNSGADIWERIKHRNRLCAGVIYGGVQQMAEFLELHSAEEHSGKCNDQGLLNMLVWDGLLPDKARPVTVFHNFYGPVKTTDVGGFRDEQGYLLNNSGRRYCLLHQFKPDRAPKFVALLQAQLRARKAGLTDLYPKVEFVHLDDNRFPGGLHVSANSTVWPVLPLDPPAWKQASWGLTAVMPRSDGWPPPSVWAQHGLVPLVLPL